MKQILSLYTAAVPVAACDSYPDHSLIVNSADTLVERLLSL